MSNIFNEYVLCVSLKRRQTQVFSNNRISNLIHFCCLLVGIAMFSCTQEVTLEFDHEPKLCLNCILSPDSLIKASVTLSHSLDNSAQFEPINNANIKLFENDILKGELAFLSSGKYLLKQKPESGKIYTIIVEAQGYETLEAFTKVPEKPLLNYSKDTIRIMDNVNWPVMDLNVQIFDKPGNDYYWLYLTSIVNERKYGGGSKEFIAPYIDDFNKYLDSDSKYGFTYFMQIRMTDEGYDGQELTFTIPDIVGGAQSVQYFLNADEHYDKYIKTVIINRMNETDELPFYEPIQIYSNIENGYGIFGSCAITTIKL